MAIGAGGRRAGDRVGVLVRNLGGVQIICAFGPYLENKESSNNLKTEE